MPKRSNEFQRLIHLIEAQLRPEGASIAQSVMMPNRAGSKPSEVDNLITLQGDPPFTVAVECQAEARKATVEWVRELHGKYQLVQVDRVVAVARAGFSEDARKEAAVFGITLLTIDEAEQFDWAGRLRWLDKFVVVEVTYAHTGTMLDLRSNTPTPPAGFPSDTREILITMPYKPPAPTRLKTLHGVITRFLEEPRSDDLLAAATKDKPNNEGWIVIRFPPGTHIVDVAMASFGLHEIRLRMQRVAEPTEIKMIHGGYAGAAVAVGSGGNKGSINVAFVQIEGQPIEGKVRIPDGDGEKIFDLPDMTPPGAPDA